MTHFEVGDGLLCELSVEVGMCVFHGSTKSPHVLLLDIYTDRYLIINCSLHENASVSDRRVCDVESEREVWK